MSSNYVDVIKSYSDRLHIYESVASRVESLLIDLLGESSIKIHFIESRAKSPRSLKEKLLRPGKSYDSPLKEISDLVGERIVLYYQDDLKRVQEIINTEFEVIEETKAHQPQSYSPEQFGYLSDHYVVKVKQPRIALTEWKNARGILIEIQVRTVLQHAWAAVSHALQYKREGDVPIVLRRKLHRLAGMFEMADEQFVQIRNDRNFISHQTDFSEAHFEEHAKVDAPILRGFLESSEEFKGIIQQAKEVGDYCLPWDEEFSEPPEVVENKSEDTIGIVVEQLERLEKNRLADIIEMLNNNYKDFFREANDSKWSMDLPFFFLLVVIAAHPNDFTVQKLLSFGWHKNIAERVLNAAHKSQITNSSK